MFNYIFVFFILILNFIVQTTVLQHFSIAHVVPNTALIIIITISLLKGKYKGAFIGLIAGLLQDILFSKIIGINALIYFLIGYVTGLLNNKVFKESIALPFLTVAVSTLSYHIMYYLFMLFLSRDVSFLMMMKNIALKEAIYNSIISIFVYKQVMKHYKITQIDFAGRVH